MQTQQQKIKLAIHQTLTTASNIAMNYFRQPVSVEVKADKSPVTVADQEIEQAIRDFLNDNFPSDAIYGEEQGRTHGEGGTWVVDPIDGTKSFLLGNPLFGCLIGYVEDGVVQAGGLSMPALGETWFADRAGPTTVNDRICRTSACQQLSNASLLTSSPDFFDAGEFRLFETLSSKIQYRRYGGDCYTYAMLAGGWADLVVESTLYPFDYLPLVPIVEQAGGTISDWQGNPLELFSGSRVIAAATPQLHEAALTLLNK